MSEDPTTLYTLPIPANTEAVERDIVDIEQP